MVSYRKAAMERAMKVREVILRGHGLAGCLTGGVASLPPSPDIFICSELINRKPKVDFGNGFDHPRPREAGKRYFV